MKKNIYNLGLEDTNISKKELLSHALYPIVFEEFLDFIDTPEAKQRLIQNTQELMDRGGFGSPTFFIDNTDMYFGNDRIQLIESVL